jgi:hypothetical protein
VLGTPVPVIEQVMTTLAGAANVSISGGGTLVHVTGGIMDIWLWDVARETLTRFTFDPGQDQHPVWTKLDRRAETTRADQPLTSQGLCP